MKTNSFILLVFSLFIIPGLKAQEFAPIGAKWWYLISPEQENADSLRVAESIFEVNADTIIQGKRCNIIQEFFKSTRELCCKEYVYSEGDSVMIWINNSFHKLFDFNAKVGDTITVIEDPFPGLFSFKRDDPDFYYQKFEYRIDSIGFLFINGDSLLVQHVSGGDPEVLAWGFQDVETFSGSAQIVEGVGNIGRFTPLGMLLVTGWIDRPPPKLSCYTDSVNSLQFLDYSCDLLDSIQVSVRKEQTTEFYSFPNPASSQLFFKDIPLREPKASLFDHTGKQLREINLLRSPLDISELPKGIYLLKIYSEYSTLQYYSRFIKY
ncbi:MAG: T9SS type A sorting domain-containing protein [Bacteroidota bacterium]